jgi:transcriptional/translational regulatory protein YebC/TACO1
MFNQNINRTAINGSRVPGTGAEELTPGAVPFLIATSPDQLYSVAGALKTAGIEPGSPKFTFIPNTIVSVTHEQISAQVPELCSAPDDLDDVMPIHANFNILKDTPARLQGAY